MKIIASWLTLLVLVNAGLAQTTDTLPAAEPAPTSETPALSLATGDVSQVELFLGREIRKTMLRIVYTKNKQDEFSKIAGENLNKKVAIVLNGKVVSEMLVTKPAMGPSLDAIMDSMDEATENEAFAIAKALVNPPPPSPANTPALVPAPSAGAVSFSLSSDQGIPKVVVLLTKARTELDVTFGSKAKIAEYASTTENNIGKQLLILLNGKLVKEETIKSPGWGHVVKVEMPSPEEAFAMAKALIHPPTPPESKTL